MRVMYILESHAPLVGGRELLERRSESDRGWFWIDLDQPDPGAEQSLLSEGFGIHPLALQDARRARHPPKVELFGNVALLLLRGLTASTHDIRYETLQIAAFVGERFLVTRRDAQSVSIDRAWEEAVTGSLGVLAGPAHVLYRIARLVTDRYTGIVLALEQRLDELEDEMFSRPHDRLLAELTEYNGRLKKLRRLLTYQHATMTALARASVPTCFVDTRHEFNDVYENTERLASLCTLYQELAVDLMQSYISITSHRLNQIIKVLTIVTVVFLPLGLIAGLYGMNFQQMPGSDASTGFFVVLGFMIALTAALLLVFRRLRWI